MASTLYAILFPATPRHFAYERGTNIALRTAHLLAAGILLGGHVFGVPAHRLIVFLYFTIASGIGLILLECHSSCRWLYLGKGVMVILKVGLVIGANIWWDQRVPLLILVVLLGSVGSHMPARFRYFSIIHGRTIAQPPKVRMEAPTSSWRP